MSTTWMVESAMIGWMLIGAGLVIAGLVIGIGLIVWLLHCSWFE